MLSAAAQWFDCLQHEEPGARDLAAWQQWLAQSPAHRSAFDQLQDLWQRLGDVPSPPLAGKAQMLADEYDGDMPVAQWLARGKRRTARFTGQWRAAAAVLLFVAIGAAAVWPLWQKYSAPQVTVYETDAGEHRDVRLPDGSALALGGGSLAWIQFEPGRREVRLERGEAFFEVAADRSRPFVVQAGNTAITAIGTAFNVRRSATRVQVTVTAGAVAVSPDSSDPQAGQRRLEAGHQVVVDASAGMSGITRASTQAATAWRTGRLEYLDEPLKYVVADVNRYSHAQILVVDAQLAELRVTGTVFENDVDGWLLSLEKFMPVRVRHLPGGEIRLERQE